MKKIEIRVNQETVSLLLLLILFLCCFLIADYKLAVIGILAYSAVRFSDVWDEALNFISIIKLPGEKLVIVTGWLVLLGALVKAFANS
ncbi:hypothetical protein [Candidatus Uabimicrobium amorphum]|uniref:Uncharacterized protein n=1 Tax=Uabimicrobium amorphum TaxID=2596890 RepID=A0A5S9IN01_UABAM|nr:hypothetical protein [Candidatus Uabimicrobium amorphum]BBM84507.1 hypothetical protein UABAM_02868 [Candidatus Uabimicrobium amorphum]